MEKRELGRSGLRLSALGLGCMGMSDFYGTKETRSESEAIKTIHHALDEGIDFLDTSDMYGPFTNEELIRRALHDRQSRVIVATKFGIVRDPTNPAVRGVNGKPAYVRSACEASLKRLGREVIDLYYLHRVDPATPIEDTIGEMKRLVQEGKVRHIGLSEASAETLRRACRVHPISALQSEYSLWTRDPEDGVLDTCRELGIGFVAYSPLGRGFLTGAYKSPNDFAPDDYRRHSPRFQGENFNKNLTLVKHIEDLANKKKCSPSQLALAWVLAQGKDIVPIPGTKHITYLNENLKALAVQLTPADLAEIDKISPKGIAAGTRYPEAMMSAVNR